MGRLYKYTGTINHFLFNNNGCGIADCTLSELGNEEKSPIRLEAHGALAHYIRNIEGTDAEERYLNATWVYDANLFLCYIEIPSTSVYTPAKVICNEAFLSSQLVIFGPTEYIETRTPAPMSEDQSFAWLQFRAKL